MSVTSKKGAPRRPWRFLDRIEIPTPERQREMALECAAARVLHRVALLRSPAKIPPLLDFCQQKDLRVRMPVPVRRLVPVAMALCKADADGDVCEKAMQWLHDRSHDERLAAVLRDAERTKARWHAARAAIVRGNLRLAAALVTKRYANLAMMPDDVFQDAVFGLSAAADRYDPNYGVKFSTYAVWWIRHAVQRAQQNTMRVVRIPAHMCDRLARYGAAVRELGDKASEDALAERLAIPLDEVRVLARIQSSMIPVSLEQPILGSVPDGDLIRDRMPAEDDLEADLLSQEIPRVVEELIRDLPPRTRGIFAMRFGLEGQSPKTLRQIGEHLDLSRERVRQIENKALKVLASRAHCSPTA